MCIEPSVSYVVDTVDMGNGSEDVKSEAVEWVDLSNFEPVASETPSPVAPEDEQMNDYLIYHGIKQLG